MNLSLIFKLIFKARNLWIYVLELVFIIWKPWVDVLEFVFITWKLGIYIWELVLKTRNLWVYVWELVLKTWNLWVYIWELRVVRCRWLTTTRTKTLNFNLKVGISIFTRLIITLNPTLSILHHRILVLILLIHPSVLNIIPVKLLISGVFKIWNDLGEVLATRSSPTRAAAASSSRAASWTTPSIIRGKVEITIIYLCN